MKLVLAAEGERELGSLPVLDRHDSVGRILVERIVAGHYPARNVTWDSVKNTGHETRAHRDAHGEDATVDLMYRRAVALGGDGLVLLRDTDRRSDGRTLNEQGLRAGQAKEARKIPAVLGLQIETLEAWLLADADAFTRALGRRRSELPRPAEQLWGDRRDSRSNHPKLVYGRILQQLGRKNDRATAASLAEAADLDVIARACPEGFGTFKRDLERAFRPFDCVVAADAAGGIGRDNDLPWPKLKGDLKFLRETTSAAPAGKRNAVIMGRKTWDSVPARFRPLPGRLNIVVTRQQLALGDDALVAHSLDDALNRAVFCDDVDRIFVIGGAEIYRVAFEHPRCRDVLLTRIEASYACDTFLPAMDDFAFAETIATHHDAGVDYRIERWRRRARITS